MNLNQIKKSVKFVSSQKSVILTKESEGLIHEILNLS